MTALRHFQRVGFRPWVNLVTQRIGIMAIRMGDQRRGARILSARHETDALALASMFPELAYERRRALEHARLVLGEDSFAAESSVGQTLTLEDAVLEALKATTLEQTASTSDGRLTPRQHEVATLIARGLTNSQIAERLVISPHTVERHVETSSTGSASRRESRSRSGWWNTRVGSLPYFHAVGNSQDVAAATRAYVAHIRFC
jgi:hypothetical protein